MKLQTIDETAIPVIGRYLNKHNYQSANYQLVTIFLWSKSYPSYYIEEDEVLYIFEKVDEVMVALCPICAEGDLPRALARMEQFFELLGQPFLLEWVPGRQAEIAAGLGYQVEETPEYREYLHEASSLRTLAGKKMQKKRNNYNYFVKNYQAYGRVLDEGDIEAIRGLVQEWLAGKETIAQFVEREVVGIDLLLDLYGKIDYQLFGVFIEEKLVAFTLGSANDSWVEVHVEKADGKIRGLYTFLASQFIAQVYPDARIVNREDDAGDEKLRKSKMSYQPYDFLPVYKLTRPGR